MQWVQTGVAAETLVDRKGLPRQAHLDDWPVRRCFIHPNFGVWHVNQHRTIALAVRPTDKSRVLMCTQHCTHEVGGKHLGCEMHIGRDGINGVGQLGGCWHFESLQVWFVAFASVSFIKHIIHSVVRQPGESEVRELMDQV